MTPTREQIIEGRDEALEHLHIRPSEWEQMSHEKRRNRVVFEAHSTPLNRVAAMTIADAERALASGLGFMPWHVTVVMIGLINPLRASDHTLQA